MCRSSTPGPADQSAPGSPNGIPTLPAFTTRRPFRPSGRTACGCDRRAARAAPIPRPEHRQQAILGSQAGGRRTSVCAAWHGGTAPRPGLPGIATSSLSGRSPPLLVLVELIRRPAPGGSGALGKRPDLRPALSSSTAPSRFPRRYRAGISSPSRRPASPGAWDRGARLRRRPQGPKLGAADLREHGLGRQVLDVVRAATPHRDFSSAEGYREAARKKDPIGQAAILRPAIQPSAMHLHWLHHEVHARCLACGVEGVKRALLSTVVPGSRR